MLRYIPFILILSACNGPDFTTSGIAVFTNGYNIDPAMIDFAVDMTEQRVNETTSLNYNLPAFFDMLVVSAEYVSEKDPALRHDGKFARGVARGTSVWVRHIEDEPETQCMEYYYVLSHELLHIIAGYALDASGEDNRDHNVEGIFFEWAWNNGLPLDETAEFWIYLDIKDECGFEYE